MRRTAEALPVRIALSGYPPAEAHVGLVHQPLPGRVCKAALSLVGLWTVAPVTFVLPPHYPWPILCLAAGAYLGHLYWTGRYRIRWFLGRCPRCGGHLRLGCGTRVSLPHTLTCFVCHFEPRLELVPPEAARAPQPLRHVQADCTGSWREVWMWDERFLGCQACGARHAATAELRRLAREENVRGALLERLAEEGRFLP